MAFMIKEYDPCGIILLVLLTIPLIETVNIDCNGKAFHCVNSTHFMICVDLGKGISSTIDSFVIPCPPTTECRSTNRFECEFPITTTTLQSVAVADDTAKISTSDEPTQEFTTATADLTLFEEYSNDPSVTTNADIILSTEPQTTYYTESPIIPTTKSNNVVENIGTPSNDVWQIEELTTENTLVIDNTISTVYHDDVKTVGAESTTMTTSINVKDSIVTTGSSSTMNILLNVNNKVNKKIAESINNEVITENSNTFDVKITTADFGVFTLSSTFTDGVESTANGNNAHINTDILVDIPQDKNHTLHNEKVISTDAANDINTTPMYTIGLPEVKSKNIITSDTTLLNYNLATTEIPINFDLTSVSSTQSILSTEELSTKEQISLSTLDSLSSDTSLYSTSSPKPVDDVSTSQAIYNSTIQPIVTEPAEILTTETVLSTAVPDILTTESYILIDTPVNLYIDNFDTNLVTDTISNIEIVTDPIVKISNSHDDVNFNTLGSTTSSNIFEANDYIDSSTDSKILMDNSPPSRMDIITSTTVTNKNVVSDNVGVTKVTIPIHAHANVTLINIGEVTDSALPSASTESSSLSNTIPDKLTTMLLNSNLVNEIIADTQLKTEPQLLIFSTEPNQNVNDVLSSTTDSTKNLVTNVIIEKETRNDAILIANDKSPATDVSYDVVDEHSVTIKPNTLVSILDNEATLPADFVSTNRIMGDTTTTYDNTEMSTEYNVPVLNIEVSQTNVITEDMLTTTATNNNIIEYTLMTEASFDPQSTIIGTESSSQNYNDLSITTAKPTSVIISVIPNEDLTKITDESHFLDRNAIPITSHTVTPHELTTVVDNVLTSERVGSPPNVDYLQNNVEQSTFPSENTIATSNNKLNLELSAEPPLPTINTKIIFQNDNSLTDNPVRENYVNTASNIESDVSISNTETYTSTNINSYMSSTTTPTNNMFNNGHFDTEVTSYSQLHSLTVESNTTDVNNTIMVETTDGAVYVTTSKNAITTKSGIYSDSSSFIFESSAVDMANVMTTSSSLNNILINNMTNEALSRTQTIQSPQEVRDFSMLNTINSDAVSSTESHYLAGGKIPFIKTTNYPPIYISSRIGDHLQDTLDKDTRSSTNNYPSVNDHVTSTESGLHSSTKPILETTIFSDIPTQSHIIVSDIDEHFNTDSLSLVPISEPTLRDNDFSNVVSTSKNEDGILGNKDLLNVESIVPLSPPSNTDLSEVSHDILGLSSDASIKEYSKKTLMDPQLKLFNTDPTIPSSTILELTAPPNINIMDDVKPVITTNIDNKLNVVGNLANSYSMNNVNQNTLLPELFDDSIKVTTTPAALNMQNRNPIHKLFLTRFPKLQTTNKDIELLVNANTISTTPTTVNVIPKIISSVEPFILNSPSPTTMSKDNVVNNFVNDINTKKPINILTSESVITDRITITNIPYSPNQVEVTETIKDIGDTKSIGNLVSVLTTTQSIMQVSQDTNVLNQSVPGKILEAEKGTDINMESIVPIHSFTKDNNVQIVTKSTVLDTTQASIDVDKIHRYYTNAISKNTNIRTITNRKPLHESLSDLSRKSLLEIEVVPYDPEFTATLKSNSSKTSHQDILFTKIPPNEYSKDVVPVDPKIVLNDINTKYTEISVDNAFNASDAMQNNKTHSGIFLQISKITTDFKDNENKSEHKSKKDNIGKSSINQENIFAERISEVPYYSIATEDPKNINIEVTLVSDALSEEMAATNPTSISEESNSQSIDKIKPINIEQLGHSPTSGDVNKPEFIKAGSKPGEVDKSGLLVMNKASTTGILDRPSTTPRYSSVTRSTTSDITITPLPALASPKTRHFTCKYTYRGRFADNQDCRKFYICIGRSEPIEGICPLNTVFSEIKKQCTKNLSHCVRNNQFRCISEGRFSDFLNDNIYYICVKNNISAFIRFKLQCQNGYHLNKTSVRCELNTISSQSTSSDSSKSNSDQSSALKAEDKQDEEEEVFTCKKVGKFPDPGNCRKYYVCTKNSKSQYRRKKKKCDSDEVFHKDKKKCVDADSYECS